MQFFDMITVVTVVVILAILLLYVMVVYKNGWLKLGSKQFEPYFQCPNLECRRVFKEPIWLTDLSKTPPESFQSCPYCGESLETSPSFGPKKSPESVSTPNIQKDTVPTRVEITRELSKSSFQTNTSKNSRKSADLQEHKTSIKTPEIRKETPTKPTETPKKHEETKLFQSPPTCSHFFGYVRTLPKNTPFPDECLWCPQLVKCLKAPIK